MNRKEFFQSVASVGVLAALPAFWAVGCSASDDERAARAAESQGRRPPQFKAKRAMTTYTGHLSFSPDVVFPLLCPVREYQWLEGWQFEMIYSDSGVAEDSCIFKTAHAGGMFWSVSRYEPPKRIEFTTFVPNAVVTRLTLSLTFAGGGTDLQWTRIFTGLNELGNESVGTWNTKVDAELTHKLEHYLRTGEMLRDRANAP